VREKEDRERIKIQTAVTDVQISMLAQTINELKSEIKSLNRTVVNNTLTLAKLEAAVNGKWSSSGSRSVRKAVCTWNRGRIPRRLQNAPRDPDKLERLLKIKEREKDEAMYMKDTKRLVTEIEMLRVVFYLMMRKR
jgi:hypothetical protein